MPKIAITIDGKNIEVEQGTTILEAAQQYGIDIPTLCHDPRLKPTAACRLCLVEVEKTRGPMPACNSTVTPGMVIKTNSEAITESRRIALELLLSDHYGDCVSPCHIACPAGIDIQGQIAYIANGQYKEALRLIKESNPLPLVCGRVCPRFCEKQCRRNLVDTPVAINMLKRFVADMDLGAGGPYVAKPKPATGHRVAIVGGGPAGLTAAYYLALEGHSVSVFESSPKLGGMLRYGIPEYRLPKATLDKEIESITKLCREVKTNYTLGKDFTIDSLKSQGFEAIFLALGAQSDQKMQIPGEDLPGVYSGIGFLRDVIMGNKVQLGSKVAVVGGGNTAIDAARTAVRLGAQEVTIIYRRSREEMPANAEEVEGAEEEGVKFQFLSNPIKLLSQNGRVSAVQCIRMALGAPDASGRRRPEPVPGSEFNIEVNAVVMAIGQGVDASCLGAGSTVKLSRRGGISANEETMETTSAGVFSGGDCTSGPATAVEAIGAGHRAATYINQYLKGQKIIPVVRSYNSSKGELDTIDKNEFADEERIERAVMPAMKPEERKHSFAEIDSVITEDAALKEAGRCLACGCQDVYECKLRELATEYKVNDKTYAGKKRNLPINQDEHPYIIRDRNKCILCGRCVRICAEVEGASALGFAYRGISATVEPALGMPLCETTCDSCGQCVSTCPTGAIVPKVSLPQPGPFALNTAASVCPECGIGCQIELNTCGNQIIKVTSRTDSAVNEGNLCHRGAFEIVNKPSGRRLTNPMIKSGSQLVETSWENAISQAAKGLMQVKNKSGAESIAVFTSPILTNEENYLIQKMAHACLGTNNIGAVNPIKYNTLAGGYTSSCSFDDVSKSDLILVYESDLGKDYPVIAIKVREAVDRGGQLVIMSPQATRLGLRSRLNLKVGPTDGKNSLLAILQYLISEKLVDYKFIAGKTKGYEAFNSEIEKLDKKLSSGIKGVTPAQIQEIAQLFARANNPVILVDGNTITSSEMDLLNDLALATGKAGTAGCGTIILYTPGNIQGMLDMGISGIQETRIKGLVAFGKESLIKGKSLVDKSAFTVLVDTVIPEEAPYPDVVLPGATFAESTGSFTNCEGRVQHLRQALCPPAGKQNWEVVSALSTALGCPMNYTSADEIAKEVGEAVPGYREAYESGLPRSGSSAKNQVQFKFPQ